MERKIVEYELLADDDYYEFNKMVNLKLSSGWELYGFLVPDEQYFMQAVVRYERPTIDLSK